jgi:hypothetical protein
MSSARLKIESSQSRTVYVLVISMNTHHAGRSQRG